MHATSRDPLLHETIDGRYRLDALIGRGGMGMVYRAFDLRLGRLVAAKILFGGDSGDEARFASEVRALAGFSHPNLVPLFDAGELEGRGGFLIMELINGPTLAKRLVNGALSPEESASIGSGLSDALAYVHDKGVVHRDVKPSNALLDNDRHLPRLTDFGIARLVDTAGITTTGLTLGTPAYLAPEQLNGGEVGPAADIYALGLVFLECLTGRRTFSGTPSEVVAARLGREPEIPDSIDGPWRDLLSSMLSRDPSDRPTAKEVTRALSSSPAVFGTSTVPTTLDDDFVPTEHLHEGATERIEPTQKRIDTLLSAVSLSNRDSSAVRLPLLIGAAAVVLVLLVAHAIAGVFSGSPARPHGTLKSHVDSSTTVAPTTTAPTTTTTTTLLASVSSAAGNLVTAVQAAVNSGGIDPNAAQALVQKLQPLLTPPPPGPANAQVQQFDQLVQMISGDVASQQITTQTAQTLSSLLVPLAQALGTTVPTTVSAPANSGTSFPPGPGHGHGHGGGPGR